MLYAVYGLARDGIVKFDAVAANNTVDAETGNNTFIPGIGKHQYLKLSVDAQVLSDMLDRFYTQSPAMKAAVTYSARHG